MVKIVVMKGLTMSHRELDRSGSTKNFYIANKWYVQEYKISKVVLVAKKWWRRIHARKPSLISVVSAGQRTAR